MGWDRGIGQSYFSRKATPEERVSCENLLTPVGHYRERSDRAPQPAVNFLRVPRDSEELYTDANESVVELI